jgi:hypothetical protein
MDRKYFQLIEKCNDVTQLATALCKNANYREDVELRTRPYLVFLHQELERTRMALFDAVNRQMSNDPQERDIDISNIIGSGTK